MPANASTAAGLRLASRTVSVAGRAGSAIAAAIAALSASFAVSRDNAWLANAQASAQARISLGKLNDRCATTLSSIAVMLGHSAAQCVAASDEMVARLQQHQKAHIAKNYLGHALRIAIIRRLMDPLFEIELELPAKGSRDAARSLFEQLKAAILDRRLTAGAKLPPTRKSADFFGVSRNTASEIYDRLLHEGYVVTRHGAGTYVAETLSPHAPSPATARDAEPPDPRLNPFWLRAEVSDALGFWRDHGATATLRTKTTAIDFRPALVDS